MDAAATLEYLHSADPKPVTYMLAPPGGHSWATAQYRQMPVTVRDGRCARDHFALDREGFMLRDAPSAMTGFDDGDDVRRRYFPEMEELALSVSGASRAVVFDHVLRRRAPGSLSPFGAREGHRPSAATRVHCDFTPISAQRRLAIEMETLALTHVERYAILNLWRSTGLPVRDAPLAVCDARSVRASDLVAADIVYPQRTGEIFEVLHSPEHDWTYFDAMRFDEVLVFKQYDSASGVARYTPHAAFGHPGTPPGTPPRESIEIRCLLIYD
ncbi:MAG TPA: CmcJ/NvfI family oxidoreductase [Burkholderiaceae bacterium]